jgi:hypothetical protein
MSLTNKNIMKTVFYIIGALVVSLLLFFITRVAIIDYVIAGNDKFAPEIEKGDFVFVCKICREYPENKYVLVWNAASTSYSIFKIVSTVNNGVATVSDGNMSFEVSVDDIHGRVLK